MNVLLAVDDGLTNGNYNWADVFFIAATILAVLAAVIHAVGVPAPRDDVAGRPVYHYHHHSFTLLALAVACIAFGWFLL